MTGRWPLLAHFSLLAAAIVGVLLFLSPALFDGRVLATGDGLIESAPALLHRSTSWDPFMFLGFPVVADPNKMFWYPLRLLLGFAYQGVDLFEISGYAIAALALYAYVKRATGVAAAGVAAATTFTLGGFEVSHFGHPMLLHPAAWSCVALWATGEFQRDGRGRQLAAIILAVALALVSGQPQIVAFAALVLVGHIIVVPSPRKTLLRSVIARGEALVAIALGIGISAIAWVPTRQLAAESIRSTIDYINFVSNSLPIAHVARALAFPFAVGGGMSRLYNGPLVASQNVAFTETCCYVAGSSLALAATALIVRPKRATFYWAFVGLAGLSLAVGDGLFFAPWTFTLPVYGLFRIPGRHAFEFTLAAAILAGFGVGALARDRRRTSILLLTCTISGVIAYNWLATRDVAGEQPLLVHAPEVVLFQAALAVQVVVLFVALRLRAPWRAWGMTLAIAVGACAFGETAAWRDAPPKSILDAPEWVRSLELLPSAPGQRVYTIGNAPGLGLDGNLPQLWNVPDVGGYTPLQLRSAHLFLQTGEDGRLLDPTARTLDIAAVRYIVVPQQADEMLTLPSNFAPEPLNVFLAKIKPEAPQKAAFALQRSRHATALALVTALGLSVEVPQDRIIADVTVHDTAGHSQTFNVRAGRDTAEIAYDRPGFARRIQHRRARVFLREGGATWYQTLWPVTLPAPISSVIIQIDDPHVALNVRNVSLIDGPEGVAYPLSADSPFRADPRRFHERVHLRNVSIFENRYARPAAWIPSHVVFVDPPNDDAALAALRERLSRIDVASTAFITGTASASPRMSAGNVQQRLFEPERRTFETNCEGSCVLVTSERWDPSWSVSVDGRPTDLLQADGMLQGVTVPAGRHVVRLRYLSKSLVTGQLIAIGAFLLSCIWLAFRRRRRHGM